MKYTSTRNNKTDFSAEQVLNYGLAPDGGLFIPKEIPKFSIDQINALKGKNYFDIANFILSPFLLDLFDSKTINKIIHEAYSKFDQEIVSVSNIGDNELLNLFHGPTLAFKDYAMCLLAKIYEYYLKKVDKKLLLIGATSGDTGSAAIQAFKGIDNISIFILHPHNSTSLFQRKQMTTSGANNVFNIALNGSFDDCQNLVKKLFKDKNLNETFSFTAVNSINWFRVLPQSIYYAWSYLNCNIDNFVVPSGNFGNIYSAYLLKSMGFPINKLIVATNENNILHRIISNNDLHLYNVVKTNSPSMDITISSNFERLLAEFLGPDSTKKIFQNISNNEHNKKLDSSIHNSLSENFLSENATSEEVENQIKNTYENHNILLDPHTAVGVVCAEKLNLKKVMCLACAHPVKFQETVQKVLGNNINYNKNIEFLNKEKFEILDNNFEALGDYIKLNA
jgi:threonine synthase